MSGLPAPDLPQSGRIPLGDLPGGIRQEQGFAIGAQVYAAQPRARDPGMRQEHPFGQIPDIHEAAGEHHAAAIGEIRQAAHAAGIAHA